MSATSKLWHPQLIPAVFTLHNITNRATRLVAVTGRGVVYTASELRFVYARASAGLPLHVSGAVEAKHSPLCR